MVRKSPLKICWCITMPSFFDIDDSQILYCRSSSSVTYSRRSYISGSSRLQNPFTSTGYQIGRQMGGSASYPVDEDEEDVSLALSLLISLQFTHFGITSITHDDYGYCRVLHLPTSCWIDHPLKEGGEHVYLLWFHWRKVVNMFICCGC